MPMNVVVCMPTALSKYVHLISWACDSMLLDPSQSDSQICGFPWGQFHLIPIHFRPRHSSPPCTGRREPRPSRVPGEASRRVTTLETGPQEPGQLSLSVTRHPLSTVSAAVFSKCRKLGCLDFNEKWAGTKRWKMRGKPKCQKLSQWIEWMLSGLSVYVIVWSHEILSIEVSAKVNASSHFETGDSIEYHMFGLHSISTRLLCFTIVRLLGWSCHSAHHTLPMEYLSRQSLIED